MLYKFMNISIDFAVKTNTSRKQKIKTEIHSSSSIKNEKKSIRPAVLIRSCVQKTIKAMNHKTI